jgi:NADPH-dependent curcumin reductase CurA
MTHQILLKFRPVGLPTVANFETKEVKIPKIGSGQVRLIAHTFSVDPYLRDRMSDSKSYISPFVIGEPIIGGGIALVAESQADGFEVGNYVMGFIPWQEEMVIGVSGLNIVDGNIVPLSYYLGILGMPGLTAYFGLFEIGKPKNGETVLVSCAAGAVGIVAGQIAKIQGCHVVGITGDDSKAEYLLNELHFDSVINYKTTLNLDDAISSACPSGIDVYFDNVGGKISDAVVAQINKNARIIICGQISLYNATSQPIGPRVQPIILKRSALMQGFIVSNYAPRFPEGLKMLVQWVQSGQLKYINTTYKGFEKLPEAFIALFEGKNLGKLIVEV